PGDIALQTSIAVGAVTAVIKEIPTDIDHVVDKMIDARKDGKRNFIIIISEGMGPDYGEELSNIIESRTKIETRFARLAHIQRGGSPSLRDRVLATQMGCAAVENLVNGQMKQVMCLRGNSIISMDIYDALMVDKLMKNILTNEEEDTIPPNKFYEMKKI
ncbi:MAG TPA: ATP-dependent 6-phosphofructokinase, partial [Clostridiales bacterium]|nr:ATP-dependent 6-phosphofructokinase [Clostridiales bacterium]